MRIRYMILFSALLMNLNSFAQSDTILIVPGSRVLKPDIISDYNRSYLFYKVKDGHREQIGNIYDDYKRLNKRHALRVAKLTFGSNTILDSGLCDAKTLAPIYHRSHQSNKVLSFNFHERLVKGTVSERNDDKVTKTEVNHEIKTLLFDSYYEDILVQAIKFKEGQKFRFSEYIYERGGTVWCTGEIVKKEAVKIKGHATSAWIVKLYELANDRTISRTTTYFIDDQDRKILSREYDMGTVKIVME